MPASACAASVAMCSESLSIHKADSVDSASRSWTHNFSLSPQLVKRGIARIGGSTVIIDGQLGRWPNCTEKLKVSIVDVRLLPGLEIKSTSRTGHPTFSARRRSSMMLTHCLLSRSLLMKGRRIVFSSTVEPKVHQDK